MSNRDFGPVSDEWAEQQDHERSKELMRRQGRSLAFYVDPAVLLEILEEAIENFGNEVDFNDIQTIINDRGI